MAARVLLVDDEPNILSSLTRRLGRRFNIKTRNGGAEAVAAVEEALSEGDPFAVVLCDMHMPGMNGLETLAEIRRRVPETVGVMLTGDADQRTAMTAINEGNIFRFYIKPFDADLLADGINAAVHQHELLLAERRLSENEERWRVALEAVGDGVWDWNAREDQMVCSEGWRQAYGIAGEVPSTASSSWWSLVHPEDSSALSDEINRMLHDGAASFRHEHRIRRTDGAYRWILARGAVFSQASDGRPERLVGTFTDVTERRLMEETLSRQAEELRVLATTDALTGLANRRSFLEKAEVEVQRARRYGRDLSLVMIDIDFFKRVNDTHGHEGGDVVLRHFAQAMKNGLRKVDVLGRMGGEEFALLLPETNGEGAFSASESLRMHIAAVPVSLPNGAILSISASFGLATLTRDDETVENLLALADKALYEAKNSGRNRTCGATP